MTKNKLSIIRSSKGMTLVEVSIAMGIAALSSLAISQVMEYSSKNQTGMNQDLIWNQSLAEITLILNTPQGCRYAFQNNPMGTTYFTAGAPSSTPLTRATTLEGQSLAISRLPLGHPDSSAPFWPGKAEPRNKTTDAAIGRNGIIFDKIQMTHVIEQGSNFTIPITIEAHKDSPNSSDVSYGGKKLSYAFTVKLSQNRSSIGCPGVNCHYNDIASCSTTLGNLSSQHNCELVGGIWRSSPSANQPQCQILNPPNPAPPAAPNPIYSSGAYSNLCPNGMAISGLDFSVGYARAACTVSSPGEGNSCNNGNGILAWQPEPSPLYPNQGRYVCRTLPTAADCTNGTHLSWDGSKFTCTNDFGSDAMSLNCTQPGQYMYWNGSNFSCGTVKTPGTDGVSDGTPGTCAGQNYFLKWLSAGDYYSCGKPQPTNLPNCGNSATGTGRILVWSGDDFQCAVMKDLITGTNCTSGQFLYYDATSQMFGCLAPTMPTRAPTPASACSPNQVLDWNTSTHQFYCTDPRYPAPDLKSTQVDYRTCGVFPNNPSNLFSACPDGYIAIGGCASGKNPDCSQGNSAVSAYSFISCCKSKRPDRVNSGRPVEYQIAYHWDMQFCRASSVVVGLCNGKSGASCVRPLGAPAGPDAYQILKCEYATLVDISSPSAPLVDMPNYAPNYDGCRIVSSDGWGTPVTCAKNEFMMGFCGSSDGEKCDVAAVRLQGAFFSVIRRVNNHKFSHQALCCPNP